MDDIEMFCNSNRIQLRGPGFGRPRRTRQNQGYDRDDDYDQGRNRGKGNQGGSDFKPRGKGSKGQGKGTQTEGRQVRTWKGSNRDESQREYNKTQSGERKPQAPAKDAKGYQPAQVQAKEAEKPVASSPADTPDAAAVPVLRESVYWRYGPFPPNSRAARRSKNKVKLGSRGLKKLAQLDGKKFEKNGPVLQSSVEVLAHTLSFLTSIERWRLRTVSTAFALAFQLDPAWTSATLEPTILFQGPWIPREHLPTQLDVMHKHRDVLVSLAITGFDGLQGALLQNFTSLVTLKIQSSRGCYGLSCIPKSVKKLQLEFCKIKGETILELEALKDSHPDIEATFVKCVDEKGLEGPAEKGKPFLISKHLAAGAIQDL